MPYSFSDPTVPYVLLFAGLFAGITCGSAFAAALKQAVLEWSRNPSVQTIAAIRGPQLGVPFVGISIGICIFLASGIQIFAFPVRLAYAIALPLTLVTSGLVWYQLGQILRQLERGGSKALDLDSLF